MVGAGDVGRKEMQLMRGMEDAGWGIRRGQSEDGDGISALVRYLFCCPLVIER